MPHAPKPAPRSLRNIMDLDADNIAAAFEIEGAPVRGRIVRLGTVVDEILRRHAYPEAVANLLGEACTLAVLVGASLKIEGRLILQAQGDGPVRYVVADYDTTGGLRGYARFEADAVAALDHEWSRPGAETLLGKGTFAMTIDQGPDMDRYQGITPIEGETLALCAEHFFMQSEQVPTHVRLATIETAEPGCLPCWRSGGLMIQRVADDAARGSTQEAWERAEILFTTLADDELADAALSADQLLFRLYHEDGVRMFEPLGIEARCGCSEEKVTSMLSRFSADDRVGMDDGNGHIHVTCEFCSRAYDIDPGNLPQ